MPCRTVPQYLDALRVRYDIPSDYQLAKFLNVTRATVSAWRKGFTMFDDVNAARVAELLDLHPCHVMACMHAARENDHPEIAKMWRDVARQYEKLGKKERGRK